MNNILHNSILSVLSKNVQRVISRINKELLGDLLEIRLRANKPLLLEKTRGEVFVNSKGELFNNSTDSYIVSKKEIEETLNLMTQSSLFTLEEEIKSGFFTLRGGHRVGIVGQVITENNQIKRIKHISALNIRICHEMIGAADKVIKNIIKDSKDIYNTLIISPPRCGKTTLLRDIVRQISQGVSDLGFRGLKVGVVDERSEIGGAYKGVAQNDLGIRTDILDRCPKAEGMMLLIRSMSPNVIVTDEIGSLQDVKALQEAINAGVRIVTTVHGNSLEDINLRPSLKTLFKGNLFKRIIILSCRKGPGTLEKIIKIKETIR